MGRSVIFPLAASKIFSRAPRDTYASLERVIKNSVLFFDEVWFEAGSHSASYGDAHAVSFWLPYNRERYLQEKTVYSQLDQAKKVGYVAVRPEGEEKAEWQTIATSPSRSYFVSYEGILDDLSQGFSRKELDFIKFLHPANPGTLQRLRDDVVRKIESGFSILDLRDKVGKVCERWDIGSFSRNQVLRDVAEAIVLSRACDAPPVLDELHKEVLCELGLAKGLEKHMRELKTLTDAMQIAISDYSSLPLGRLVELRQEPSIESFRKAISEISETLIGLSNSEALVQVTRKIGRELIKNVQEFAPKSKRRILLSAVLDCIPSAPAPPPYSFMLQLFGLSKMAASTVSDLNKTEKWKRSFGCFWMKLATA